MLIPGATYHHLDDVTRAQVEAACRRWRSPVRRRDVSVSYAVAEVAGVVGYPYVTQAEYDAIRRYALRVLTRR